MTKRRLLAVLLTSAAIALAIGGYLFVQKGPREFALPAILEDKDPTIVFRVQEALDELAGEPENAELWARLGFVYEANGLDSLALESYDRSLAIADTSARAWYRVFAVSARLGDVQGSAEAISHAVALAPDFAPVRVRYGFWALDQGLMVEARNSFQQAVKIDASNPGGYWGLARVLLLEQKAAQAAGLLERLLEVGPDSRYTHQLLGNAYRQMGNWGKAREALARGEGARPVWPDAWEKELARYETGLEIEVNRAMGFVARGAPQLAILALEKLRQLHPGSLVIPRILGKVLVQAQQWERALEVYTAAQLRYPDSAELLQSVASVHFGMGNTGLALNYLDRALAADSTLASAHAGIGSIFLRQGKLDLASGAFQRAAYLEPQNPAHLLQLGMVSCELRRWEEGLVTFQRVVELDSTSHEAYMGWAVAARRLGRLQDAEAAVHRALALKLDSPALVTMLESIRQERTRNKAD